MAFLLFSTQAQEFVSLPNSFIYVLSYVMGDYSFESMSKGEPILGRIFFVIVSIEMIVLGTIFRAIILGNVSEEFKICKELAPDQVD